MLASLHHRANAVGGEDCRKTYVTKAPMEDPLARHRARMEKFALVACALLAASFLLQLSVLVTAGVYASRAGTTVNAYLSTPELTPQNIRVTVNKTHDIIRNVDSVSNDMVPVSRAFQKFVTGVKNLTSSEKDNEELSWSEKTRKSRARRSVGDREDKGTVKVSEDPANCDDPRSMRAYSLSILRSTAEIMSSVTPNMVVDVLLNASSVMKTVSGINVSSVTNVMDDVHNPEIQEVIKARTDRLMSILEGAAMGVNTGYDLMKGAFLSQASQVMFPSIQNAKTVEETIKGAVEKAG